MFQARLLPCLSSASDRAFVERLLLAYPCIYKTIFFQFLAVVDVTAIDDDVATHDFLDDIPAGHAELAPLGHQGEDIGTVGGIVHVLAIGDGIANATLALVHGNGVEDSDGGTVLQQLVNHHQSRGFTHVVGLWLEGEAKDGNGLALKGIANPHLSGSGLQIRFNDLDTIIDIAYGTDNLVVDDALLLLVDTLHSFDDFHVITVLQAGMHQCLYVFGEAAAAIAAASIEELGADTGVGADALANAVDIGADALTEVGNVVHERDAGSEHGIGGIFGHLGRGDVHEDDTEVLEHQWAVEAGHHLLRLL